MSDLSEQKYLRMVQTSVTCFINFKDEYLFLKRSDKKKIDPGRLNGIGGRVEPGEDYLAAAIRETEEETGYLLNPEDLQLSAIGKLEGGYSEDWVMCFFKVKVKEKLFPNGHKTPDGELVWINESEVLDSQYELVDDLNYVFKDIVEGVNLVFFNAQVNQQEKIESIQITKLPLGSRG